LITVVIESFKSSKNESECCNKSNALFKLNAKAKSKINSIKENDYLKHFSNRSIHFENYNKNVSLVIIALELKSLMKTQTPFSSNIKIDHVMLLQRKPYQKRLNSLVIWLLFFLVSIAFLLTNSYYQLPFL